MPSQGLLTRATLGAPGWLLAASFPRRRRHRRARVPSCQPMRTLSWCAVVSAAARFRRTLRSTLSIECSLFTQRVPGAIPPPTPAHSRAARLGFVSQSAACRCCAPFRSKVAETSPRRFGRKFRKLRRTVSFGSIRKLPRALLCWLPSFPPGASGAAQWQGLRHVPQRMRGPAGHVPRKGLLDAIQHVGAADARAADRQVAVANVACPMQHATCNVIVSGCMLRRDCIGLHVAT